MNPNTGELARLDGVAAQRFELGDRITREDLAKLAPPPAHERDLRAALARALEGDQAMVAVSSAVAQRVRLGDREIARRRRRR